MIQKATAKILCTSAPDSSLLGSGDHSNQSDSSNNSDTSVLTDSQSDQISVVGHEVEFAANTLSVLIKRELEAEQLLSPARSTAKQRVLPMSPSTGGGLIRDQQRKPHTQHARRNLADFDR